MNQQMYNGALRKSEQVFLPLDQSGVSNLTLGERKIKAKCPLFRPINIQYFCPLRPKLNKRPKFHADMEHASPNRT